MLVVPGSLEGASPSPRRPETGEGLRPVKAVVCVFAAALRDRLREVSEEEAESADVERWARRLLGAGVVLRDRFRFLSLDLRLLFGVGDLTNKSKIIKSNHHFKTKPKVKWKESGN